MVVTNATPQAELQQVMANLHSTLNSMGLTELSATLISKSTTDADDCDSSHPAASSRAFEEAFRKKMQEVVPGVYCGCYQAASNLTALRAEGITHVVNCIPVRPCFPENFEVMRDRLPFYFNYNFFFQSLSPCSAHSI